MTFEQFKKRARRRFKKIKRFVRKYVRFLIRHTKAKDYSVLFYTVTGLILLIVLISLLVSGIASLFKKDNTATTTTETTISSSEEYISEEVPDIKTQAQSIYDRNKDMLILVNQENLLSKDYSFTHHTLNCGMDVDERIYDDMLNMLNDLNKEDLHYTIISAYRSNQEQTDLIKKRVSEYMSQGMTEDDAYTEAYKSIQKPGASEHESGLCFDVASEGTSVLDESVATQQTAVWLVNNSYKYGFILRYPKDKENLTGITYEPWHFRYVGKEAAAFMYENDLCLEEFHQLITK